MMLIFSFVYAIFVQSATAQFLQRLSGEYQTS